MLGILLDEEIEGVDDHHLGDDIDLDPQGLCFFLEHHARQDVAEGILLPVDEVFFRRDPQGIRQDRRPAMHRRTQPDHLRREGDRPVIVINGLVGERHAQGHSGLQGTMAVVWAATGLPADACLASIMPVRADPGDGRSQPCVKHKSAPRQQAVHHHGARSAS